MQLCIPYFVVLYILYTSKFSCILKRANESFTSSIICEIISKEAIVLMLLFKTKEKEKMIGIPETNKKGF